MKKLKEMIEIKSWKLLVGLLILLALSIGASFSIHKLNEQNETGGISLQYGVTKDEAAGGKNEGMIALPNESFSPPEDGTESMTIATYNVNSETKRFESDIASIHESTNQVNGYISSHNIGTHKENSSIYKVGRMTLRIPKEKVNEVLEVIRENTYVLTESSNSNDVTKQYRDLEASIKSLEEQESKLNELFSHAKTVDEIIKLDEKVRSVIQEKEMLQRNYLSMKDEVAYSRMDIQLKEVSEYTMVETIQDGSFSRIKNAFITSFKNIGETVTGVLVFIASISPFLILILLGTLAYVKTKKKRGDKHE